MRNLRRLSNLEREARTTARQSRKFLRLHKRARSLMDTTTFCRTGTQPVLGARPHRSSKRPHGHAESETALLFRCSRPRRFRLSSRMKRTRPQGHHFGQLSLPESTPGQRQSTSLGKSLPKATSTCRASQKSNFLIARLVLKCLEFCASFWLTMMVGPTDRSSR